jgi:hypothetical protein
MGDVPNTEERKDVTLDKLRKESNMPLKLKDTRVKRVPGPKNTTKARTTGLALKPPMPKKPIDTEVAKKATAIGSMTKPKAKTFGAEFKAARADFLKGKGGPTFMFKGKSYSVKTKEDVAKEKKMAAAARKSGAKVKAYGGGMMKKKMAYGGKVKKMSYGGKVKRT